MSFIQDDFLLLNKTSRELYHQFAKDEPIYDYHCHLSPKDVAEDRRFANLYEIWLEGDHYKWRAMRTNGIDEKYITGDATPYEKFLAFADTLPQCLRNPLYHWSHLELKRYFGIETLLNRETAPQIWAQANEILASPDMSARGILKKFKVKVVCTTDDPVDRLEHHAKIAQDGVSTKVYPTYRPDKALGVEHSLNWNSWVDQLEAVSGVSCGDLEGFQEALRHRHDFFHQMGGRLSDHGLETAFADFPGESEAEQIFSKARRGFAVTPQEKVRFASFLMEYFGELDTERNWTKQMHLGAMRNVNDAIYAKLGPDAGCDTIGDWNQAQVLSRYLGRLSGKGILPKTVIYNLNPADNYVFGTMVGNFQGGDGVAGKMQFGSGWWFLDQKEAMIWQINALSNLGLLGHFVGMLTDSRSFMSYCRHEYFRRILCQLLGADMENGELPNDMELVGGMARRICYSNAEKYFGLKV